MRERVRTRGINVCDVISSSVRGLQNGQEDGLRPGYLLLWSSDSMWDTCMLLTWVSGDYKKMDLRSSPLPTGSTINNY